MALIGARLKMPGLVHHNLAFLLSNDFLYSGLFTSHNPNLRIFNSDALCSYPAVIAESLVYSRPGIIELLPAWSDEHQNGKITNLQCRTQAEIVELSWDMKKGILECTIRSKKKQEINLLNSHYDVIWTEKGDSEKMRIEKGMPYLISFKKNEHKSYTLEIVK
jgi:hypothetical protein